MSPDVPLISNKLTAIKDPNLESAALIASILSQAGVPTALWGMNVASLYGVNLVPLVSLPSPSAFPLVFLSMNEC